MELVSREAKFNSAKTEVVALHDGEEVIWNIGSLDKIFLETKAKFDMFEHINAYWGQLKKKDQDAVFNVYKEIRQVFDEPSTRNQLTQNLYSLVAKLLDFHDFETVELWVKFHANVNFPDSTVLKTEYIASSDRPGTREQTYLREDYNKLITMALILRSMIPIWGEYIGRTRGEAGTNWKEFYAFRLLNDAKIFTSEAMSKLRTYVEYSTLVGKGKPASILGGVSSEDFPNWVLALVVTRKVCVGDIRGVDPSTTLVTYIYNYVHQKVQSIDNSFNGTAGMIKEKSFEEQSNEGEKNLSRLEGYKVKQEIAPGDIVALEYSMRDPFAVALKLCPTIDMASLQRALVTTEALNYKRIYDSQIVLLQWVMKPVISTRGVSYLCKATVVRLLAIAQTVLWHNGHYELAGLCTATASEETDEMQISGVDSRARIPKELIDKINVLFPYMKRPTGKVKTAKLANQALASIDSVVELLSNSDWVLTADETIVRKLTGNQSQRRYSIPHDIKIKLAELVIQIAQRGEAVPTPRTDISLVI